MFELNVQYMFDSSSVAVIGIANFKIFSVEINTKYFDIQLSARECCVADTQQIMV